MVLTADDTLMSDYHNNEFLGFGACAPPSFIPQWLFKCLEHDFHWLDNLLEWTFTGKWYNRLLREFYKGFAGIIKQKAKKIDTSTWILND